MGVQNAVAAVRAFTTESEFGTVAVELRSPGDEFLDPFGGVLDQNFCCFRIAETVACIQRVLQVQADFILVAERRSYPALRILRAGIGDLAFREHQHTTRGSEFDRRAQPCDSSADDEKVCFRSDGWHCRNGITAK